MAVRSVTLAPLTTFGDTNFVLATWAGLTKTTDDTGAPIEIPGKHIRSVQVTGTPGTGGTLVIEGSNDGTTYATLGDNQGTAVSFTAAGLKSIGTVPRYIRPRVSAGDVTTSFGVVLLAGKP